MNEKGFIPWIFNENKEPYYVDSNGNVVTGNPVTLLKTNGQPAHLTYPPDGWKDTLVNYGRSTSYMGLFREFTVPMKFVKDGAKILRHILWTKGKNAVAYFALHKINRLNYPIQYDPWFIGEIDLYKIKQGQDDDSMIANVMQGGLSKLLKSNENTVYEINVDKDPDKKRASIGGLEFANKIIWTVYNGQEIFGTPSPQYYWLGMGISSKTGISQGVIVQDVQLLDTSAFPNDYYFLWSVSKTIVVTIKGTVTGICNYDNLGNDSSILLGFRRVSDSANTVFQDVNIVNTSPYSKDERFSMKFNFTITVNPHERLYARVAAIPWTQKLFTIDGVEISAQYDVAFDYTYSDFLLPYTLGQRLVDKITNGKYTLKSNFLQGLDDIGITSGTALRRAIPSSIKTCLVDFFQAMKTRGRKKYSIGLGIEGDQLVIEELDYFFQNAPLINLGTVDKLQVTIAEDLLYNTIKSGYKDQTVDDLNGRNEVNVQQLYSTPNTKVAKELDLVSPYRADPYGIMSVTTDQFGQQQTSSTADNETFIINVEKSPTVDTRYYTGDFEFMINFGQYYIKIPGTVAAPDNGLKLFVTWPTNNSDYFTVENTSYILVGYTLIRVTEPVTNLSVVGGTIVIRDAITYHLKRLAYSSITGVDHPAGIFNVELSPKRSLLNCGGLITSTHDKENINFIKFESAIRNIELSTTLNGNTVTEKADEVIGGLQAPLFAEYYMTFETALPVNASILLSTNPYGIVEFIDGKTGIKLKGFLWDGGIKPEPKDKQTWKLIAAPNQNLSQFIR